MSKKRKRFDLDHETETLSDWSAYGTVWRSYKGSAGVKQPDCTAENPCLRTGWYSFGGDAARVAYEYVSYTVSNGHRVIAQGFDDPFHARLLAAAPALLRFARSIAEGNALALSVVDDAKALVKEIREPVAVPSKHDSTEGPYDPDDYPTRWSDV